MFFFCSEILNVIGILWLNYQMDILTLAFRILSLTLSVVYVSRSRYIMHLAVKEFICNAVISYA